MSFTADPENVKSPALVKLEDGHDGAVNIVVERGGSRQTIGVLCPDGHLALIDLDPSEASHLGIKVRSLGLWSVIDVTPSDK